MGSHGCGSSVATTTAAASSEADTANVQATLAEATSYASKDRYGALPGAADTSFVAAATSGSSADAYSSEIADSSTAATDATTYAGTGATAQKPR